MNEENSDIGRPVEELIPLFAVMRDIGRVVVEGVPMAELAATARREVAKLTPSFISEFVDEMRLLRDGAALAVVVTLESVAARGESTNQHTPGVPDEGFLPITEVMLELEMVADGAYTTELIATIRRLVSDIEAEEVPEFVAQIKRLKDIAEQVMVIVQEAVVARTDTQNSTEHPEIPRGDYCYSRPETEATANPADADYGGFHPGTIPCPHWGFDPNRPLHANGFCRLLNINDWSSHNTILWDQVKQCGINKK